MLKDKLNWAHLLAESKHVSLSILDSTIPLVPNVSEDNGVTRMDLIDSSLRSSNHYEDGDKKLGLNYALIFVTYDVSVHSAIEEEEKFRLAGGQLYVHADIYKLEQVLRNLITNAVFIYI